MRWLPSVRLRRTRLKLADVAAVLDEAAEELRQMRAEVNETAQIASTTRIEKLAEIGDPPTPWSAPSGTTPHSYPHFFVCPSSRAEYALEQARSKIATADRMLATCEEPGRLIPWPHIKRKQRRRS